MFRSTASSKPSVDVCPALSIPEVPFAMLYPILMVTTRLYPRTTTRRSVYYLAGSPAGGAGYGDTASAAAAAAESWLLLVWKVGRKARFGGRGRMSKSKHRSTKSSVKFGGSSRPSR